MSSDLPLVGYRKAIYGQRVVIRIFCSFVFLACKSEKSSIELYQSETLVIQQVGEKILKHISYLETDDYGNVPCNGMIYLNGNEAIIYDTPTDIKASSELINWLQKQQQKQIVAVLVTHFHVDCLGGLKAFHEHQIPSYAANSTLKIAKVNNEVIPENGFDKKIIIRVGSESAIAEYFGPGHTTDNIVGYIPAEKTLFGGCLIKAMQAGKGNLSDANTDEWATTVQNIKNTHPDLKIVIPGHGNHGGMELLDYTIELFQTK
ncbi:MAG: subclass B1 metallo-beta-lactamase [Flavobacteriaceae bacterium]